MSVPHWTWTFFGSTDAAVEQQSPVFATRADAETWLGENWRRLASQQPAVAQVQLRGQGVAVGPAVELSSRLG